MGLIAIYSVYPVRLMSGLVRVGISARLKREGESMPPSGTPVVKMRVFELNFLKKEYL